MYTASSTMTVNSRTIIKKKFSIMKKSLIIALILISFHGIVYSQEANNPGAKLQSSFVTHLRYPKDLEKASIPSFFALKVQHNEKAKQYNLEFSDSADPLIIKEILRIREKLDFDLVYNDLNIEQRDIPIIIPIEIRLAKVSKEFSAPKNRISQNLINFQGKQAVGEFYFYAPLVLLVVND